MTVYALERANNDLVVFLLVIFGAIVFTVAAPLPAVLLWAVRSRRPPQILSARAVGPCRTRKAAGRAGHCGRGRFTLILFGVAFYPELKPASSEHPCRSLVFHRRLLRPQPAVRVCGSPGRRRPPHPDRRVAARRAVRAGSCANASHGSAARARAARLGSERDAVSRHRRPVGRGLLLCRPEHRLSRHSSSPGAVRAGLPPSIGQRPRGTDAFAAR